MKDKEAREYIRDLDSDVKMLSRTINELNLLSGLSVKDCPKCKHPVLAQHKDWSKDNSTYRAGSGCSVTVDIDVTIGSYYQCLTCGSKFTCSEKCVYELVHTD